MEDNIYSYWGGGGGCKFAKRKHPISQRTKYSTIILGKYYILKTDAKMCLAIEMSFKQQSASKLYNNSSPVQEMTWH